MTYFLTALISFWAGVYVAARIAQWYYRSER